MQADSYKNKFILQSENSKKIETLLINFVLLSAEVEVLRTKFA